LAEKESDLLGVKLLADFTFGQFPPIVVNQQGGSLRG
jgi:hypothetical protein